MTTVLTQNTRTPGLRRVMFAVAVALLGATACARYPLGMSEAEFKALPPERQLEARAKQAELDAVEERRRAEQIAAQRQERAERMARMYGALGALPYGVLGGPGYAPPAHLSGASRILIRGGQVSVPVGDGLVRTKRDWRPALPAVFVLAEGETVNVAIDRADRKSGSAVLRISRLNGTIVAGYDQEVFPLVGTYPLEVDGVIRGAAISIAPL